MPWDKAQTAIERVREEHAKFKASNEAVRKESVQKDMPLRPGEVPLIVSTHDKFADQGRANLEQLIKPWAAEQKEHEAEEQYYADQIAQRKQNEANAKLLRSMEAGE